MTESVHTQSPPVNDSVQLFLPYQRAWLADTSPVKIWEKSRRIGATYAQAYEDVSDILVGNVPAVWFSSADESAAREYIHYCRIWSGLFSAACAQGEHVLSAKKTAAVESLHFANGGRIHALSSNPKSFRSKGGKVVLDEFAHHGDARELWKAARPAVTWGFPLRILSTHNGKLSLFYSFIEAIQSGTYHWKLFRTDIYTAAREGLADRIAGRELSEEERSEWIQEIREGCFDESVWLEEYCCVPVDGSTAFLTLETIQSCVDGPVMPAENPEELARQFGGCDLYIGIDIGRKHDATVLCALALQDGVFINAIMQVQRNKTFAEQSGMIQELLSLPRARKCCIDATGIGAGIAEEAELKFGRKVEQTVFSSKTKEELAYNLKRAIEGRAILLPNDALLIADLHSIKRGYTRTASARLEADRGKTDGNGDRFWALALALRAAKEADVQPIIPLSKFVAPRRDPRMPFRALPPPARRSRR